MLDPILIRKDHGHDVVWPRGKAAHKSIDQHRKNQVAASLVRY